MMIGTVLLVAAAILVLFGVGQRVLDRMRLTDRQALVFMALILAGGLIPDVPLGDRVRVNVGGFLVPLVLCLYLFAKAGTSREVWRAVGAAVFSAAAVLLIDRFFPSDPELMPFDVNYLYGLAAGAIACVLGRSRRAAFIGGVLGIALADVVQAVLTWRAGVDQALVLGGAGAFDAIVISGFTAVLLRELVGEAQERASRKSGEPERAFRDGEIVPEVLGAHRDAQNGHEEDEEDE